MGWTLKPFYVLEDKLIWKATPHGNFTVNSAYRLIREHEQQDIYDGESSQGNLMERLWRAVWLDTHLHV